MINATLIMLTTIPNIITIKPMYIGTKKLLFLYLIQVTIASITIRPINQYYIEKLIKIKHNLTKILTNFNVLIR